MHALVGRTALAALLLVALFAAPAAAHGPTVRISYDGLRPAELVVRAGQTVHFHNVSSTPRTFTVLADDGSFESPPLARGEGRPSRRWMKSSSAPPRAR